MIVIVNVLSGISSLLTPTHYHRCHQHTSNSRANRSLQGLGLSPHRHSWLKFASQICPQSRKRASAFNKEERASLAHCADILQLISVRQAEIGQRLRQRRDGQRLIEVAMIIKGQADERERGSNKGWLKQQPSSKERRATG